MQSVYHYMVTYIYKPAPDADAIFGRGFVSDTEPVNSAERVEFTESNLRMTKGWLNGELAIIGIHLLRTERVEQ